MYSCVLFDLDGTLSDPLEGIARSINYALERHGYPTRSVESLGECVGPPLDQSFSRLTESEDSDHILALVYAYRERYLELGYAENVLYPEVRETLDALQRADVAMALCTSKPEPGTRKILARFGLESYFGFLSCGDVGVEKWQQIEVLRAAGTIDDRAIMIGDRAVDVQAGRRNGIATGAVTWGYGSMQELESARPDLWFEAPVDWLRLSPSSSTGESVL